MIPTTEQPSQYESLDTMSVGALLEAINDQDAGVPGAVRRAIPQIETLVNRIVERMSRGGRLFYIGAGTSGRLGVVDASEIPPTYGMPQGVVIGVIAGGDGAIRVAVEGAEDDPEGAWRDLAPYGPGPLDTVVGIAASGTTPYVIGGLNDARAAGLLTGSITCNHGSPVAAAAECPVEAVAGPEFVTGSTRMKAGTAQKLVLNMISTAVMIRLGRVEGNRMVNMQLTNKKLVERGTRMIAEATGVPTAAAREMLQEHGSVKAAVDAFLAEARRAEAGGGVVRTTDGRVLMMLRRGMWDLPKGHREAGESLRECALREVTEECGLEATLLEVRDEIASTVHSYRVDGDGPWEQKHTTWFAMVYRGDPAAGRPQTEEDITAIEWLAGDEARRRAATGYKTVRDVIEKLLNRSE